VAAAAGAVFLVGLPVAGWAASFSLTTTTLTAKALATPVAYPTSVVTANVGGTVGRPQAGDTVTVVFSVQLSQATLCSSWTNGTSSRTLSATLQIADGGSGNDVLTVSSVSAAICSAGFRFGSLDLGSPGYVSATRTYTTSTIALTQTAAATTVKLTLGTASGAGTTVSSGAAAVYIPNPLVADLSGNLCGANTATSVATVQL
jgi:hypothetical protein